MPFEGPAPKKRTGEPHASKLREYACGLQPERSFDQVSAYWTGASMRQMTAPWTQFKAKRERNSHMYSHGLMSCGGHACEPPVIVTSRTSESPPHVNA